MRTLRALSPAILALTLSCASASARPNPASAPKPSAPSAKAQVPGDKLAAGDAAFEKSDYAKAEAAYRGAAGKQRGPGLLGLARTLVMTGRYAEAVKTAQQAQATGKQFKAEAAAIAGEALRREGKLAEAESTLRKVESLPEAREARLLLGEILIELGKRSAAEPVLMTLVEDYNSDKIQASDGRSLAMVGRAAALLRSPHDANDAFNEAERASKGDVQTLLWRAELFLDKYDPGHAEEVTQEVLAKAPHHPDALIWMAHVKLAQALDFDEAERLVKEALKVNPKLTQGYFVLAGIALRDMEIAEADKQLDAGLKVNPRDLDLLSLKAAARFLADDDAGFEQAQSKVLGLNSEYSRMYQIVGEYAEWEHRYDEIVKMMEKAERIDNQDAKAIAQLGLNLIRAGSDSKGVTSLQRAFKLDPFNVRVFNTLNLYEKVIPQHYVSVKHKQFVFRYHKDEKAILERYVPQLMNEAWRKMTKEYGFTPSTPVGVELYAERENFAIRTSGLPNTAIQGVCFGKTLASMSTKQESFNLGMTLWHELAHVFHIQISKSHVPRWFTEGLAEYETIAERDEWQREQDPDLFAALRSQRLPHVGNMNRAFTRAEELNDVATAYYASSQILSMLVKRHGMKKMSEMLSLWGQGKRTPEVVQSALAVSTEQVDEEFKSYAKNSLQRYEKQFVPMRRAGALETAKAEAGAAPKDAAKQTRYALALLKNGKAEEALKLVDKALELDAKFADARFLKVRFAMAKKQVPVAQSLLKQMVKDGQDGYAVQMALADIAEALGDKAGMKAALQSAANFDPSQAEPLQALVDMAKKDGDTAGELGGLRKLALLEQHDPRVYRRLMQALMDKKEYAEALKVGQMGLYADMTGMKTHQLFAEVLVKSKMVPRAVYELESAVLCPGRPKDKADAHAQLAETYMLVPNARSAAKHAKLARELDAENPRLKKLKL